MLQDLGASSKRATAGGSSCSPDRSALPDTVQDVILTRVDRLGADREGGRSRWHRSSAPTSRSPSCRAGASFRRQAPRGAAGSSGVRAPLRDPFGPGREYAFKHAVIQEVVYGQVPADRRRELHGRLVDAIERIYPERLGEHSTASPTMPAGGRAGSRRWPTRARPRPERGPSRPTGRWRRSSSKPSAPWSTCRRIVAALEHAVDLRFGCATRTTPSGSPTASSGGWTRRRRWHRPCPIPCARARGLVHEPVLLGGGNPSRRSRSADAR